jgi:hypothetical protein
MNNVKINTDGWTETSNHVFWGEIAPCDHVVQIYKNDEAFLDLLSGFVDNGIKLGESIIVIATNEHLAGLSERLGMLGHSVPELISTHKYFPLDAETILSKFMVNDWPDENLFNELVASLIVNAKTNSNKVRAFGEMVALLWAKGQIGATIRLEHLWNMFCEKEAFCLFCAYPESGFTQDASESVMHICGAHSKMISNDGKSHMGILYR